MALLAALSLLAAACGGGSTASDDETSSSQDEAAATAEPEPEPTEEPTPEPTAEPTPEPTEEPVVEDDSSDGDTMTDTPGDESDENAVTVDAPPIGETEVTLIDAGAEPRMELRLDIAATCRETATMTQVQELNQTVDGTELPSVGAIGTVVQMESSAVRTNDNFEVRSEVINAASAEDTPAEVVDAIDAQLAVLVGLLQFQTINDRGIPDPDLTRVEGLEGLGTGAELVETLSSQSLTPFPLEAVGPGARWQAVASLELQGLDLISISDVELVSIDGTVVELIISTTQQIGADNTMNVQGVTAEVLEWESTAIGVTTLDLATVLPITSSVAAEAFQILSVAGAGEIEQEISSELTITSEASSCTGSSVSP